MKTWNNGDSGAVVKEIIDGNFASLSTRVEQETKVYVKNFTASDWSYGIISIQYSEYQRLNPIIELYIKTSSGYTVVLGGYEIKDYGIELQSDIAYEGKVVIR